MGPTGAISPTGDTSTQLTLQFTSIPAETDVPAASGEALVGDPTGAAEYLVYATHLPFPDSWANVPNPCGADGELVATLPTQPYLPIGIKLHTISGLTHRSMYSLCMKARDRAGNTSITTAHRELVTQDRTPPQFAGLLGGEYYKDRGTSVHKLNLYFSPATSPDVDVSYYKIRIWTGSTDYDLASGSQRTLLIRTAGLEPNLIDTPAVGVQRLGMSITRADFDWTPATTVYATVESCDDASLIPGSVGDNCNGFQLRYDEQTITTTSVISVPDIIPPLGFLGVNSVNVGSVKADEGKVTVSLYPTQTFSADYFGYKIYDASGYPTTPIHLLPLLGTCPCASPGNCSLTCVVDNDGLGLPLYKTYRFYARAYDQAGNLTEEAPVVSPTPNWNAVQARTIDKTPPVLPAPTEFAALSSFGPASVFAWSFPVATDTQADAGSTITYEIYRRDQTPYASGDLTTSAPPPAPAVKRYPISGSPALGTSGDKKVFSDTHPSDNRVDGGKYYYTACAVDMSGNRSCAGTSSLLAVPDITPPQILGGPLGDTLSPPVTGPYAYRTFSNGTANVTVHKKNLKTNTASTKLKIWDLEFQIYDNASQADRLRVWVHQKFADTPIDFPTAADTAYAYDTARQRDVSGIDGYAADVLIPGLNGQAGTAKYVNYLVRVKDEAGNETTKTLSVWSDNVMTVASIGRNIGSPVGGKLVFVTGTGFTKGTENGYGPGYGTRVTIDGTDCQPTVYTDKHVSCLTPARDGTGGSPNYNTGLDPRTVDVWVENPDNGYGTFASLIGANGYVYHPASTHVCDNPGSWGAYFAGGAGTRANPFKICTETHLSNIRLTSPAYLTSGYSYQLADNLDLGSFSPIGTSTNPFVGDFYGNGLMILNFTTTSISSDYVGLFGAVRNRTTGGYVDSEFTNLTMIGLDLKGRSYFGALIGKADTNNSANIDAGKIVVSGVYVQGDIRGYGHDIGGIVGRADGGAPANVRITNSSANVNIHTVNAAFYVGGIAGYIIGNGSGLSTSGTITHDTGSSPPCVAPLPLSYHYGDLTTAGGVGGIFGTQDGCSASTYCLQTSSSAMTIDRTDGKYIGGAVGWSQTTYPSPNWFVDVTFTGSVSGCNYVGGVAGSSWGVSMSRVSSTGSVASRFGPVGGLLGGYDDYQIAAPSVAQSFSSGSINFTYTTDGPVAGIAGSGDGVTVNDSYSTSTITVASIYNRNSLRGTSSGHANRSYFAGTIVATGSGTPRLAEGTTTACFYDGTIVGVPFLTRTGTTGHSTADMQKQSTFQGAGWDFTNVWKMPEAGGYPILKWQ
jgi:hypothetical protein